MLQAVARLIAWFVLLGTGSTQTTDIFPNEEQSYPQTSKSPPSTTVLQPENSESSDANDKNTEPDLGTGETVTNSPEENSTPALTPDLSNQGIVTQSSGENTTPDLTNEGIPMISPEDTVLPKPPSGNVSTISSGGNFTAISTTGSPRRLVITDNKCSEIESADHTIIEYDSLQLGGSAALLCPQGFAVGNLLSKTLVCEQTVVQMDSAEFLAWCVFKQNLSVDEFLVWLGIEEHMLGAIGNAIFPNRQDTVQSLFSTKFSSWNSTVLDWWEDMLSQVEFGIPAWNNPPHLCSAKMCEANLTGRHTTEEKAVATLGGMATVSCEEGFAIAINFSVSPPALQTNQTVACFDNLNSPFGYFDVVRTCALITCGEAPEIDNMISNFEGEHDYDNYGTEVTYNCPSGHVTDSGLYSVTVRCTQNAVWETVLPKEKLECKSEFSYLMCHSPGTIGEVQTAYTSHQDCREFCLSKEKQFAGVTTDTCYCGNWFEIDQSQLENSECSALCPGPGGPVYCGGEDGALSVYAVMGEDPSLNLYK
ncbi:hypothetical protein ScPMuIL_013229 [Solemya velum]